MEEKKETRGEKMICFECSKSTDRGEMIGIYKGRDEFFCSECAKELFM